MIAHIVNFDRRRALSLACLQIPASSVEQEGSTIELEEVGDFSCVEVVLGLHAGSELCHGCVQSVLVALFVDFLWSCAAVVGVSRPL